MASTLLSLISDQCTIFFRKSLDEFTWRNVMNGFTDDFFSVHSCEFLRSVVAARVKAIDVLGDGMVSSKSFHESILSLQGHFYHYSLCNVAAKTNRLVDVPIQPGYSNLDIKNVAIFPAVAGFEYL